MVEVDVSVQDGSHSTSGAAKVILRHAFNIHSLSQIAPLLAEHGYHYSHEDRTYWTEAHGQATLQELASFASGRAVQSIIDTGIQLVGMKEAADAISSLPIEHPSHDVHAMRCSCTIDYEAGTTCVTGGGAYRLRSSLSHIFLGFQRNEDFTDPRWVGVALSWEAERKLCELARGAGVCLAINKLHCEDAPA